MQQVVHYGGYQLLHHPPQPGKHVERLAAGHLLDEGVKLRAVAQLSLNLHVCTMAIREVPVGAIADVWLT